MPATSYLVILLLFKNSTSMASGSAVGLGSVITLSFSWLAITALSSSPRSTHVQIAVGRGCSYEKV